MTTWESQLLNEGHSTSTFDCGIDSLNRWLTEHALRAQSGDAARTCVWTEPGSTVVVAYYSIAATMIHRSEVGNAMAGGFSTVPAYLLARLAVDKSLHGQGLGGELLADAFENIVQASANAAGRLIVVDAIDDNAAAFYRHHHFKPLRDNPHRLVLKIASVRKAFDWMTMQLTTTPGTGLVSMLWHPPGDTPTPIVASVEEFGEIADRIRVEVDKAQERGSSKVDIDFMSIVQAVLGRDPGSR